MTRLFLNESIMQFILLSPEKSVFHIPENDNCWVCFYKNRISKWSEETSNIICVNHRYTSFLPQPAVSQQTKMLLETLVLLAATTIHGRPIEGNHEHLTSSDWAWKYLKKFGYIDPKESFSTMTLSDATGDFQTFTGINVTCE